MDIKKLTEDQIKVLRKPLPPEAVSQHPTKKYLSSIKAIYVVERLNEVFGIGSWHLHSEPVDTKTAMIVVKSRLTIPEYGIELESYGGNDNGGEDSKNYDLGDSWKGSVTDAFTKICSYLEIGIDVFKGKQTGQPKKENTETPPAETNGKELPWLNESTKEMRNAVAKLSIGAITVDEIKKFYKVSKKVEGVLSAAYKPAPK